ncbi:hypothetical protein LSH36_1053g01022 [Paralvinella palmiformis]|uniref:Uncharacterized protein n=1 Tax=Paralvinella palmiformis TaxID=53620 RepID=A0AAD9IW82_9ANNE|nr:hypothetical protein LSH36_1053g01022 [Paralvinella palmiformis]
MESQMAPPKQRLSKSVDTLLRVNHLTSLCPADMTRPALCQSTPELPVACRRSALPRERSVWRRSIIRMRDDLSQFGRYLRRSFTDASEREFVVPIVPPEVQYDHVTGEETAAADRPTRRITIGRYCRNRKSSDRRSWSRDDGDVLDQPDHNFSSSLVLRSLQDGHFSAELSLRQLPPGDLVIYIRGHELEIVLDRSPSIQDRRHRVSVPSYQGVVELPIFVDENSLMFAQDAARESLVVTGRTKGCLARRRSLSYSVLQSKAEGRPFWKAVCRKLGFRRAKSHDSITRSQSVDDKAFRVREYSRETVW